LLSFEKIAFLCTHFGDRQTDKQIMLNRWTEPMRKGALAISSGALKYLGLYLLSHYNPLRSQSWFIFEEHLTFSDQIAAR